MGLVDLIVPRRCGICARVGASVCAGCRPLLVRCGPPWCERCGAPGPWPVARCAECAGRRIAFASARAALVYDANARAFVRSWKERGRRDLTAVAASLVAQMLPRPAVDLITFVPPDRDRELRRGHSTAASLAYALAGAWGIPAEPLLRRRGGGRPQRGLSRAQRRRNVAGAFTARGAAPRRVCLVDDVYTTGATVSACATELRRVGARRVEAIAFARAVR
jgi:predicted amidophosphoribosyltransferase